MSNTRIVPRPRILALIAALGLGLAACGADETIDAAAEGSGDQTEQSNDTASEDTASEDTAPEESIGEDVTPDPTPDVSDGFTPLTPRNDLIQLQSVNPAEVLADPNDDQRLLIRFQGAAEPCYGATVEVTETEDTVTVALREGLDPNAAAMSCIAQVFDYEVVAPLGAPLGERMISVAD